MAKIKLLDTVCWPSIEYMQPDSLMGWEIEYVRESDTISGGLEMVLAKGGEARRIVYMHPVTADQYDPIHIEISTTSF